MGTEEKNRNEILSRIIADLFDKAGGGGDLSSNIHRLRDELKKAIESEATLYGKFRGLVESFREIIPEEKQRYNAALKALSTTSKLNQQEIIRAINNQLEELKILEKGLLGTAPGSRDERKVMEAKARQMRDEISKLREIIGRLESEEKEILNGMAAREKEMGVVEKAVGEVFTAIGAEITHIRKKVEEFTAESAAPQPIAPQTIPPKASITSDIFSEDTGSGEQKSEVPEYSAPQEDTEFRKKCPMCGGQMNLQLHDKKWICYSCAYEEPKEDNVQGKIEEKIEHTNAFQQTIETSESAATQDTQWQKKCPMCGGQMNFQLHGKMWICYSCAYEETKEGEVPGELKSEHTNTPDPIPSSEPIFDLSPPLDSPLENQGSIQGSPAPRKPSPKKKPCPSCSKKMNWIAEDKAWLCPFCGYERRI